MTAKLTKNQKAVQEKYDKHETYPLQKACELIKEITFVKFDASVDMDIRLGVDPTQADQMVRGTVTLPHGTGKEKTVLALCPEDQEKKAEKAGADYFGLDEYINKIEKGWTDIDVVVATKDVMPKIGKLGKILGPKGLMPNPKTETVGDDIAKLVEEMKKGKIAFKVDQNGIIHCPIGRVSFATEQLHENARELLQTLADLRPVSAKGFYFRGIYMSSTMSPSITIDRNSIKDITNE